MQKHGYQSLREIQRREREDLILQVAKEVFLEKGYYETSIDEIAARVGVAKGTIYLHFASKEALVVAIVRKSMEAFVRKVDEVVASSEKTVRMRLEELVKLMYTGLFLEEMRFSSVILNSLDLQRLLEEKKSQLSPLLEALMAKVGTLLEEGKASGELDESIPTPVLLSSFFQLFSPHSYERLLYRNALPPEEIARHLVRIYFCGIAGKAS